MGLFTGMFNRQPQPSISLPKPEGVLNDIFETINLRVLDMPKPVYSRQYDWVLFGQNNSFPQELIEYKNSSSIHSAILEGEARLISGNGILFGDTRENSDAWIIDNFKQVPFWRKLDGVFSLVARDQVLFGYSCFEVIYSMDRTRIVDINWVDASRIACGKKEDNGQICDYYYSENWRDIKNNPPREIEAYNPNEEGLKQLMFISAPSNSMDYYSLPNYYPALKWIKSDGLMADYSMSAIQNGFSPSIVFKFYKKPSPEERRMNAEQIKAQHGGTKNAGKALIFYADGKELAPDVDTLDATNIDQRLLTVSEQIVQQIISGHRAYPQLLGIATPGKLGYSNELLQSWEIYNTLVIKPERKLILDAFKEVLIYNGVSKVTVEELNPIKIIN